MLQDATGGDTCCILRIIWKGRNRKEGLRSVSLQNGIWTTMVVHANNCEFGGGHELNVERSPFKPLHHKII